MYGDDFLGEPETSIMGDAAEKCEAKDFMYMVFEHTCGLHEQLSHFDREIEQIGEENLLYILNAYGSHDLYNRIYEKAKELEISVEDLCIKAKSYLMYMYIYKRFRDKEWEDLIFVRFVDLMSLFNIALS